MTVASEVVAAAKAILAGDDSGWAAAALEAALHTYHPYDEDFEDLLEVLALYSPGMEVPYTDHRQLCDALFGLVSSTGTAIASAPPSVQLTYAYDGHGHPVALTDTTTDRRPPETYDNPNGYDAGGPWAVGGPAYPVGPTTPVTYGYDDLARPVQIASRTGDRDGQVGLAEGGSVVVLRSGVAANGAGSAISDSTVKDYPFYGGYR